MPVEIGSVEAIFRYPVKSMAGERLDAVNLGWHGIDGDRRLAFRRIGDRSGFPWLTAGKLPDLLLFTPLCRGTQGDYSTHVRTPDGEEMPVFSEDLAAEVARRRFLPGDQNAGECDSAVPNYGRSPAISAQSGRALKTCLIRAR